MDINERYRKVPLNVMTDGKFLNIDWIRWVETLIACGLIIFIIWSTTFVIRIKVICISVICPVFIFLFLHGIKNRSVTQVIRDIIFETSHRKKYSLGSVANGAKRYKSKQQNQFGSLSVFEKLTFNVKSKFKQFDDRYGKDE